MQVNIPLTTYSKLRAVRLGLGNHATFGDAIEELMRRKKA